MRRRSDVGEHPYDGQQVAFTTGAKPCHGVHGRLCLLAPEVLDHLAVRFDVWSEDKHLQPFRSGFE